MSTSSLLKDLRPGIGNTAQAEGVNRLLFSALGMILEFSSRFFILNGTNNTKSLIPLAPTAYYISSKNISMNLEIT